MATILDRNRALVEPYSLYHQPLYIPGSSGIGLPIPGADTVVCIAPGEATTPYNEGWKKELELIRGDAHTAMAPDDHYPNQVMVRDNELAGALDPNEDPRARALLDFWTEKGYSLDDLVGAWQEYLAKFDPKHQPKWVANVRYEVGMGNVFFLAKKTQPVIVQGRVDLRYATSEGPVHLEHDSVVVTHPDDPANTWVLQGTKFDKRYNFVQMPNGLTVAQGR
ncbi:MAG TPA: hypothetical protein VJM32_00185 [Candidatus Saccharimonadales bacterium]|nr:hypothetical protein [Candidatus Saccharimonadales bacterium]